MTTTTQQQNKNWRRDSKKEREGRRRIELSDGWMDG
jgi:hypothetical protein